ncbi:biliverdin-producing heme oxygenase [Candidatus Entotheonella palauensis]|uniref:biliverdin-producing heme oxygenase n=1 Tax=Candidatus Entotheonella palauensis TaxID=93172 RepID=UPI000B7D465E|nr:biliverdin-producing heme oxygenase [Candidatus Entotheonella palauensis]
MNGYSARPLMEQLRNETHALHKRAERQQLQTELMRGRLPKSHFIAYLEQLFLIHQRLDSHLCTLMINHAAVAHIIQPHHYHASYLEQDLRDLGRHPQQLQPLISTAAFLAWLDHIATHTPLALLGVHYVLEGSKNGGRLQAVKVRDAYALAERQGTMYLDPYGEQQSHFWSQYQTDMNRAALGSQTQHEMIEAAKTTFQRFIELCQELMASDPITRDRQTPEGPEEVIVP